MQRRAGRIFGIASVLTATALVAVWTVPLERAHAAAAWNFASEFRGVPSPANPAPDSYGNPGVWSYLQGTAHNTSTYALLPTFLGNLCSNGAVDSWTTPSGYPVVDHNRGTTTATCATDTHPAGAGWVHPASAGPAIIGWKSPISGTVSVAGSVADDDGVCGDGILWSIDKGSTTLASGSFVNGGSQAFSAGTGGGSLASQAVSAGDQLFLLVLPGADYFCDATRVNLTITAVSSTTTITGAYPGNLNVASGQQVHVANAQVGGNVKVAPGGLVSIVDSRVGGNVSANGALEVTMCKTTVGGSVSLIGTTGDVLVGDGGKCPTNTIGGGLEIDNTSAGVVVGGNDIGAKLACTANFSVSNNGAPNTAATKTGQCAAL